MLYQFKTTATMKDYNRRKWWIDSGIIREITIEADSIQNALDQYRETVSDRYYIDISKTALKNKQAMYIDTKSGETLQTGYVITASTEFSDSDTYRSTVQYIDLWVTINIISNPFKEGI